MSHYQILRGENPEGPFTVSQLKAMWQAGQINTGTKYCLHGQKQWRSMVELADEMERKAARPRYLLLTVIAVVVVGAGLFAWKRYEAKQHQDMIDKTNAEIEAMKVEQAAESKKFWDDYKASGGLDTAPAPGAPESGR